MLAMNEATTAKLDPVQAAELAVLVDIEAGWENMRRAAGGDASEAGRTLQDLRGRQKAYDAFRSRLAAYNKRYTPQHVPELLLNTPARLGIWCRKMRELHLQIEHDSQAHCPVHLLDKAYRCGDRIGVRLHRSLPRAAAAPTSIREAIQELEAIEQWCDDLAGVTQGS